MLAMLTKYRTSLGFCSLPTPGELSPLVPKLKGRGGLSARQIRHVVSKAFEKAILKMVADGLVDDSKGLEQATVHWLRHTSISEDVSNRPSDHVRDDVGHENIATTSLYIDVIDVKRHASAKQKKLISEEE